MMHKGILRLSTVLGGGLLFACFLGWAAYRQGLFYDADLYGAEAALIVLAAGAVAASAIAARRALPWWALAPLGLAAAYGCAWLAGPASVKGTADSLLRWCAYGAWLTLAAMFASMRGGKAAGHAALHAAGLYFVWGGLAGWFGWIRYPDIVYRSSDAALSMTGARLAGFLQYPNACGAVAAFYTLALWQLLNRPGRAASGFAAVSLVPALTALLLTESRGAMLALAAAGFVSLLAAFRRERRGYGLAVAGIASLCAAIAARFAFGAMENGTPGDGIWALIATTALFALTARLLRPPEATRALKALARLRRLLTGVWGGAAVFAICAAIAYLLLASGGGSGGRAEGNLETAGARTLYYADALRMFADRPLLGAGGEAWRMQVGLYQSGPYIGNEVHSGYLEVLIDTGAIGFAALLAMLAVFAVILWRREGAGRVWGPAAVLLLHAGIDFDWSYAYIWLLLLFWLALHLSLPARQPSPVRPLASTGAVAAETLRIFRLAGPILLLLAVAIAATAPAIRYKSAAGAYAAAQTARGDAAKLALLLDAQRHNPPWNRPRLEASQLLPAAERAAWLLEGLRYEPNSPTVHYALGMAYADAGAIGEAETHLKEALRLARFDRDSQNAVIARFANLAQQLMDEGDDEGARLAGLAGIGFFERYEALYARQYAGKSNPWSGTELFVSAKVNAARCAISAGRRAEAEPWLREALRDGDADWQREAQALLLLDDKDK
ncbi:O-antigen ligase family protein [Cohnella hashimotonis]|uniref:O-antigen ligase family protein n=1 Tax=Cohnella hashimotonis TaxID=2826895 RepID=A0ABT6TNR6_9BACL|nr:O-antigen ligase family protein [Cohnella hashimotonis]MDI4647559.1 O-antigen ligase family protein [Cohnella hashimotonis]